MPKLELIRSYIFWITDFLKGGRIAKHFNEIECILKNNHSKKAIQLRRSNLNNILKHAYTTLPFYKNSINSENLKDFPVINKFTVRENFNSFKSNTYLKRKKFKVSSSGSTGTPFVLYQDKEKHFRNIADTIFFGKRGGYQLGQHLYFMRVWTNQNKKNKLLAWMQNIEMQNVASLSDKEIAAFIAKISNNNERIGILSYASSLEAICKYLDKIESNPIKCNVNTIIANSERLNEYTYDALKKYFNDAPVVSRYSNAENGILAQQLANDSTVFEINWASYYIEILKFESDEEVEDGQLGRVVVTDLFNYCMPLIRYDTGDVASIEKNDEGVKVFTKIEGRKQDLVYTTSGDLISSMVIGGIMKKYTLLTQYQFIQETEKGYLFKLNSESQFEFENQMIEEFKEILGADSKIKAEYLDEIPLLASGKRRQVVNNYNY